MSCSVNKLKPVFRFYVEKNFARGNNGGLAPPCPLLPYGPDIIAMSKYSNAKFEFPLDKFFTFALRSWQ